MRRPLLALIRFYQRAVSPGLPAACRYDPTCSRYAYEAIERYGAFKGSWLAVRRLSRCVPWRKGGFDPVPGLPTPVDADTERPGTPANDFAAQAGHKA